MNDLIQALFLYFARFPKFDSIAKSFNLGTSNFSGYSDFKASADALTVNNVAPDITDYVFGVNEKRIRKRIDSISGYYLMVDYGNIEAMPSDRTGHTKNFFNVAITVAHPINENTMDDAIEVLISSHCLDLLRTIKNRMKQDERETITKDLKSNYDAVPFVAPELNGSVGWTLTFTREGVLL